MRAIWNKAWLIVLVAVLSAAIAFACTFFLITPQYEASAMFYVNNSSALQDSSASISSGDSSTSRNLVDSYIVILNTEETYKAVTDYAGISRTHAEMKKMVSAVAVNETEVFKVVVTSPSPQEAEALANAIAQVLPNRISTFLDGTSAKVVDKATLPTKPSSPSYPRNIAIGGLLGLLLTIAVVVLREILDVMIRGEEDISLCCKHPILASVPDMSTPSKGGSYYDSCKKKNLRGGAYSTGAQQKRSSLLGKNVSFAASEAYKLLRTKLQFSFAGDNDCRVIGLSSALSGEGKSLTAINLAYTLSQLNKKVILIDCDMRRPTMAEKLGIIKTPRSVQLADRPV